MNFSMQSPEVKKVLTNLYQDARTNDRKHRETLPQTDMKSATAFDRFSMLKDIYMPVDPEFGNMIYALGRSLNAKLAVEFGTSKGISTLFLASAIRDNGGGGKVVTTEFIAEKAEVARKNLTDAGLESYVDFRVGDAMKTLKETLPGKVDLVLLDGEKSMYLDILKLLEPHLRTGSIICSDNIDHAGAESLLEYLRNPANGYVSTSVMSANGTKAGQEISVRL